MSDYTLPDLDWDYGALEPHISGAINELHHDKHHATYVKGANDAVAKARRAFEFAQAQMSAGTVNVLTVLNTENALFSAQDVLVQVEYSHLQALIDLYTALGGGWQQG